MVAEVHGDGYLRIGQLAGAFGLNPKTIRYYEAIGLLPPPERGDTGYRLYTDVDVERLRFIGKAKTIGLTLDEIRQVFQLRIDGEVPCGCVLGLLDQKVAVLDAQMRALDSFRQELLALRERSTQHVHADAIVCGIIEAHESTPLQEAHAIRLKARTLHR
jgi:DNA-binding transcriptional MerR regulator